MISLGDLGLTDKLRELYNNAHADFSILARVIREHKELYVIQNENGEFNAEITGNMRYSAESRADFPAVGDWIEASIFDGGQAIIQKIHSRISQLERQSVGAYGEKQLIATNINIAFIVQAVDRDFNLNRLERYFVIAHNGNIEPVIILNKADLISKEQLQNIEQQVKERMKNAPVFMTSTLSGLGLKELVSFLKAGLTYCFIGSSGVGKSSIINYLLGKDLLDTKDLSNATHKGKHTTTHRELILLENGSVLIDTPGMREVGMTETADGMEMTFQDIAELSKACKFNNCTHEDEPGCKVLEAIEDGTLTIEELDNFKKLERQSAHFTSTVAEKRKKDKDFGKMIKYVLKNKKKNKY
jgi:ribosome biogenesis GTPase